MKEKINSIVKWIVCLLIVIFSVILLLSRNNFKSKYITEKGARESLQDSLNRISVNCDLTEGLLLKEKELSAQYLFEKDSLAKVLKNVRRSISRTVQVELDIDSIPTDELFILTSEEDPYSETSWSIADTGKCWVWKADAQIVEGDLDIQRTSFDYKDRVTDTIFFDRSKILFFKIGKRKYFQKRVQECGTETIKPIKIFKKRPDDSLLMINL